MKSVCRLFFIFIILFNISLFAQNVQEVYEDAKSALMQGDYESALLKITIAQAMIEEDPNLDPNGNFTKKLLPKLEQTANEMSAIVKALDELNRQSQMQLSSVNDSTAMENVNVYTGLAKDVSNSIIEKRDSILSLYNLDPQYTVGLQKNQVYRQVDMFVTQGIMDTLSQKFTVLADGLTSNLNRLNDNFKKVSDELNKMKKSASASRAERQKLEKELEKISQERMNYLNTISEMLMGQASPENPQLKSQFLDNNVEGIFNEMIQSEINRIQGLTEVDSATYKELMKNYDRIKSYNDIFLKNNISSDQSELLAQYERAIKKIQVVQPKQFDPIVIGSIVGGILLILILVYILSRSKGTTSKPEKPASPPSPPAEPKK